jgi:hypothetical protein
MFIAIKSSEVYNDDIKCFEDYHQIHYFNSEDEIINFLKRNSEAGYKLYKQVDYKIEKSVSIKID